MTELKLAVLEQKMNRMNVIMTKTGKNIEEMIAEYAAIRIDCKECVAYRNGACMGCKDLSCAGVWYNYLMGEQYEET